MVLLIQLKNELSMPEGNDVWVVIGGADELLGGAFEGSAMVLLYPSRESAKVDAR
jgi:hypothetical protein